MKFDQFPLDQAAGTIIAHTWRGAGRVLKKGHLLTEDDLRVMAAAGQSRITAARLDPEDLHEDQVARRVAAPLQGAGLALTQAFTGRCNIIAQSDGLLVLDRHAIERANAVDESITVATLPPFARVKVRQMVATVKVIPFAVPTPRVAEVVHLLAQGRPLRIAPFAPKRVNALFTTLPGYKESLLLKSEQVLRARLHAMGAALTNVVHAAHERQAVGEALAGLGGDDCDLLIIGGASAIMDRRDVIPGAITALGGAIERFGMPVDPGNLLLLARLGATPVIAMPGCARSIKENGFDWVLARLMADLPITSQDIGAMGVGGLLEETLTRPQPRSSAVIPDEARPDQDAGQDAGQDMGQDMGQDAGQDAGRRPRIAAIVLAAGQSRRMGPENKLLLPLEGTPMVRTVVGEVLGARVSQVVVVTGHQAPAVGQALDGLAVRIVPNQAFDKGMSTSLRCGLEALPAGVDGAVICLGDMPYVAADHIDRLIAAYEEAGERSIHVASFAGRRGNPVLWDSWFFDELKRLEGDKGGRLLLRQYADSVHEIVMDDGGVLTDIDRPEDLKGPEVPLGDS